MLHSEGAIWRAVPMSVTFWRGHAAEAHASPSPLFRQGFPRFLFFDLFRPEDAIRPANEAVSVANHTACVVFWGQRASNVEKFIITICRSQALCAKVRTPIPSFHLVIDSEVGTRSDRRHCAVVPCARREFPPTLEVIRSLRSLYGSSCAAQRRLYAVCSAFRPNPSASTR